MRFQRLSKEALQKLEKEFIQFLAVNGIEAQDWENFKKTNPDFGEQKIDEFSDVIMGSMLQKAKYAEFCEAQFWMLFKFEEEQISLIHLQTNETSIDFSKTPLSEIPISALEVRKTSKPYQKEKEDELFEMMQKGCYISEGEIYQKFDLLVNS